MKFKKGDQVKIISGKDRGKTGVLMTVMPNANRVVIDGLNVFKKRSKPKKQGETGQTVLVPRPLQASNVMLICSNCKRPTRIGHRLEGARSVRYCKKCKATI